MTRVNIALTELTHEKLSPLTVVPESSVKLCQGILRPFHEPPCYSQQSKKIQYQSAGS